MTDPEMAIRDATLEDVPGIRRVARRAWRTAYGDFLDEAVIDAELAEWYTRESVASFVERDDVPYLVATAAGDVVGYAKVAPGWDRSAELSTIYVDPDAWGAGVGSCLLDTVTERLADRGVESLELSVFADNDRGIDFYESRGFERVSETTSELEAGSAPAYVYRADLDG